MNAIALHREVRNAISLSDDLGRYEHAVGNDDLAGYLAAIRTVLDEIERDLGRSHVDPRLTRPTSIEKLERGIDLFRSRMDEVIPEARDELAQLIAGLVRVLHHERRLASRPPGSRGRLLGIVPLVRAIPQDLHSVIDHVVAGSYLLSALIARTASARSVGLALGCALSGGSLVSDQRLSAVRVLPIEAHVVLDHGSGLAAVAAPFAMGYARRDPIAAGIQIAGGLLSILAALATDYRGAGGAFLSSLVGRRDGGRLRLRRRRVAEAQRPLEGYAGASVLPNARL